MVLRCHPVCYTHRIPSLWWPEYGSTLSEGSRPLKIDIVNSFLHFEFAFEKHISQFQSDFQGRCSDTKMAFSRSQISNKEDSWSQPTYQDNHSRDKESWLVQTGLHSCRPQGRRWRRLWLHRRWTVICTWYSTNFNCPLTLANISISLLFLYDSKHVLQFQCVV